MENEEEKVTDESIRRKGEKFLKELREMPYNTDRVGQVFVTIPFNSLSVKMGLASHTSLRAWL